MSATPKSNKTTQRINRAYVDISSTNSPLQIANNRILGPTPHVALSSKVKENTPVQHTNTLMNQHSSPAIPRKRTFSSAQIPEVVITSLPKKSKLSTKTNHSEDEGAIHSSAKADNATPEFPNGSVYCHQCNKKRDAHAILRCSSVHVYQSAKSQTPKERSCLNKYCVACLKNRYDDTPSSSKFTVEGNNFKCPKCRDICNCPRCRKSKGLDATGSLPKPAVEGVIKPSKAESHKTTQSSKTKAKASAKLPPAKPLPSLKWRRIPNQLSQKDADDRIFIREFVMRFLPLFEPSIAKASVEELKVIAGKSRRVEEGDCIPDWISEMCIRAIIIGLLGFLAKAAGPETTKAIRCAQKELRTGGANLNKIWSTLQSLRETMMLPHIVGEGDPQLSLQYPDPLPPPLSMLASGRNLRSVQQPDNGINVIHSTQLIPVVISLMEESLETPLLREEIEFGVKGGKDCMRDSKEAVRLEQERWDVERKTMEKAAKSDKVHKEENRTKRSRHKDHVTNLDNAVKILVPSFAPRFMPIGSDTDGRIYYALSSSLAEREAAEEFLGSALSAKRSTLKKKGGILSPEERKELKDWSWFVAVWGKKAPNPHPSKTDRMEVTDESDDDETVDKWWGFWEPEEIRQVAQFVAIKAGIDDENVTSSGAGSASTAGAHKVIDPTTERYQDLVQRLKDYAALLEWRAVEDKYRVLK